MKQPLNRAPQSRRRRPWLIATPLAVFVLIALAWSAFWFYTASQIGPELDGWRAREAKAGRIHTCSDQTIGGYPFRIEVDCVNPSVEFQPGSTPGFAPAGRPTVLAAKNIAVVAQVYDPTLLVGEIAGPMTIGEPGQPANLSANWSLAQVSVRGTPQDPQRISIAIDRPEVAALNRSAMELVASASHVELHGRLVSGSVSSNPVIETVWRMNGAYAPALHPLAAKPTDGEISATLTGLKDFAPKPWNERFREIASAGGGIEITSARLAQGDILAVGAGKLTVNANGRLDGQITLTVAGLDKLIELLGADQQLSQLLAQKSGGMNMDKIAGGLDRILPGLGGVVRNNSGSIAAAGLSMLGEPRDIEGRKGISLPLKFTDGAVSLGPIPVGSIPAVF